MSYYNQQQPPVGVPPPQGYPQEYGKDAYPPPGYPPQGYPPPQQYPAQGYPPPYAPQYAQPPPQQQQCSVGTGCMEGWLQCHNYATEFVTEEEEETEFVTSSSISQNHEPQSIILTKYQICANDISVSCDLRLPKEFSM